MVMIAESSAGLGWKRSRLSSDYLSSVSRMTRSFTPLHFPNTGSKLHCKTLNQTYFYNDSFDRWLVILVECIHFPSIPRSRYSECQLYWLSNKRIQKQVMTCNDFNITLCINYYKPFHTVHDLNMIKVDIENDRESTIKMVIQSPSSFNIEFQTK